jgi:site-specific DNA recombinase
MVRGKRNKVKAGNVIVNGRPPYGYKVITKDGKTTLEIIETEAQIIRLIYTWYTVGDDSGQKLSLKEITRRLTEMRVPSPIDTNSRKPSVKKKRGWGAWNKPTVCRILKSETYIGIWHYGKATRNNGIWENNPKDYLVTIEVPAIIDKTMWEKAQNRFVYNKQNAKRNLQHDYLMSKRVTCGCGYKMTCRTSSDSRFKDRKYFYYCCPSHHSTDFAHKCPFPSFRAEKVDHTIWSWIKGLFEDEKRLNAAIRRYIERNEADVAPLKERLATIEKLIKKHEKELTQAQKDYKKIERSTARRTKAAVLADIERVENTLDSLDNQKTATLIALEQATISEADLQTIRAYAEEVLAGMDIANATFKERRWLIEKLNIRITLTVEDKQMIAYLECWLGEKPERLPIESNNIKIIKRNQQGIILTARLIIE